MERLPAHVEAAALMRRVEADGGFATVIQKGDAERGTLILLITERGCFAGLLERTMQADWTYRWAVTAPAGSIAPDQVDALLRRRREADRDLWLIELDIANAERFIAETIVAG